MRYSFNVSYHGTVSPVEDPDKESIHDVGAVVRQSFMPDLQAGVKVEGMNVHITELPDEHPHTTGGGIA